MFRVVLILNKHRLVIYCLSQLVNWKYLVEKRWCFVIPKHFVASSSLIYVGTSINTGMATHTVCLDSANMSRSVCWITKSKCEYLPTGRLISVYEPDSLQMRASFCPRKLFAFLCFTLGLSSGLRLFLWLSHSISFIPFSLCIPPSSFFQSLFTFFSIFHQFIVSHFSEDKPHMFALMCSNYDSLSISWW